VKNELDVITPIDPQSMPIFTSMMQIMAKEKTAHKYVLSVNFLPPNVIETSEASEALSFKI